MYRSAADALLGLVSGEEKSVAHLPWKIKMSERPARMENGIDYCYVEVTFGNGVQYGIPAYGSEVKELRERAAALSKASRKPLGPMIVR